MLKLIKKWLKIGVKYEYILTEKNDYETKFLELNKKFENDILEKELAKEEAFRKLLES